MKIQFYALFNGRTGYLKTKSKISWTIISNPLLATIFADYEEVVDYVENTLSVAWRTAFDRGSFSIVNIIEEL